MIYFSFLWKSRATVQISKCRTVRHPVWYRNEKKKNNSARTSPELGEADAVRHFFIPVPD
jgi:hypothetical protein